MKVINEMRLVLPSRSANESFARAVIANFTAQLDPTLDELGDIKTAVSEAVTNCVVHAYPDSIGPVFITAKLYEGGVIEVAVRDTGRGIPDVETARTAMYTTGGADRSGMGFTIMESFMDVLRVRSAPGKGTTVLMRKRLALRANGGGRRT